MSRVANEFEGKDIQYYIEHLDELINDEGIVDDELTAGRIRTIYARAKYERGNIVKKLADYYNLSEDVIRDIRDGKLFASITKGCDTN